MSNNGPSTNQHNLNPAPITPQYQLRTIDLSKPRSANNSTQAASTAVTTTVPTAASTVFVASRSFLDPTEEGEAIGAVCTGFNKKYQRSI